MCGVIVIYTMLYYGDIDWPTNASRRFVSISWASCSMWGTTEGPTARVEFLGRGSNPLPTSWGVWESSVSPLQRGSGRSSTAQKFSNVFSTQDGLSWHYNIVNCGLSCSHLGKTPVPPPLAYASGGNPNHNTLLFGLGYW